MIRCSALWDIDKTLPDIDTRSDLISAGLYLQSFLGGMKYIYFIGLSFGVWYSHIFK